MQHPLEISRYMYMFNPLGMAGKAASMHAYILLCGTHCDVMGECPWGIVV